MTTRVRKSFLNNLNSQDWMDKSTKDAAREKVRVIPARGRGEVKGHIFRTFGMCDILNSLPYFSVLCLLFLIHE